MNVNQKIEQALSGVVTEIYPLTYPYDESKPDIYIVYNPELDTPGFYADDEDQEWMQYMQIHLYKKGNYIEKRKEIKEKLRENGMVVTDIETMYEKDGGYNHLCFSCYVEEDK